MDMIPETISAEIEAAKHRFCVQADRTEKHFGYGATDEALRISQSCYGRLAEAIEQELKKPFVGAKKGPKDLDSKSHRLLQTIPPDIIALVALNATLRGVVEKETFLDMASRCGEHLRHELFSTQLGEHDKKLKADQRIKAKIEKWVKERHGSFKQRLQAAFSTARKEGFSFVARWTASQHVAVGSYVLDVLLVTLPDLFTDYMGNDNYRMIEVTEGASKIAQEAMEQHVRRYPVFLPSEEPPVPWTDFTGGGPVDPSARALATLVRLRHRESVRAVKAAIKSGQMQPAIDAVNDIQAVPWKINTFILDTLKQCRERGIDVEGLPSQADYAVPDLKENWDSLSDEEKRLARVERAEAKKENRTLRVDRARLDEDLTTAEVLAGMEQFYIPHNLDWRGREYPLPSFNFQRSDVVRALFLFKDGAPIGEEGIAWLKVHVANCGDFGKVSKKPYDERIKWVDQNIQMIRFAAENTMHELALEFWTQADKPFLFLAACLDLTKALNFGPDYVCCLPCSWDGSCSGAQHLCAATRSADAWKVNLCDREEVHDLYTIVAKAAKASMAASEDPLASTVLAYDGDWRKVFKRNTMTTFYGSKGFGMAHQHMTDLMEPLRRDVLKKKRKEHPFGDTYQEHHAASRLLASHASAAIAHELPLAMEAMKFLQSLAVTMAHAGKPLEWVTPVGLPWSNRYHDASTTRLCLWMHDHGVRKPYTPKVFSGYQKNINKDRAKNGAAPNFVHACDAAHLLLTVNAAKQEGITQFALVHDSFGSVPGHAARFQSIIREQFVSMYSRHDVLAEVLQQAKCDLIVHNDRLSALEEQLPDLRGDLNIKEVLDAQYSFA